MYDFFLSFKYSDKDGNVTEDYKIAKHLYDILIELGYSVFFSPKNISEKRKSQYMLAIDEALDETSHMVVIGTSIDNILSEYVKYEWLNFNTDILNGEKSNSLLVSLVTENVTIKELPRALRINEAFEYKEKEDMSNIITFLTDIVTPSSHGLRTETESSERIANKYDVNDEKEQKRLATQTMLSLDIDYPIISKILSNKKNIKILDIGCNNGQWIRGRTEGVDNIDMIIGIDVDAKVIAQANSMATTNQRFYSADCESPDFYDRLCDIMSENNIANFDFVCVPMILMHLSDPFRLLKTLYKVMGVNAHIFIREEDDSLVLAHPDEGHIVQHFLEISDYVPTTGYRKCGREVYEWLYTLEFRNIQFHDASINTIGKSIEEREAILNANFSYIKGDLELLYSKSKESKHKNDLVWIDENYSKLERLFCSRSFFYKNGIIIYTAMK